MRKESVKYLSPDVTMEDLSPDEMNDLSPDVTMEDLSPDEMKDLLTESVYASADNESKYMESLLKWNALMMNAQSLRDKKTTVHWKSNTNIHLIDYLIRKHDPMVTGRDYGFALYDLVVDVRRNLGYREQGDVTRYKGFYYLLPGDVVDSILDVVEHTHNYLEDSEKYWLSDMWSVLENVLGGRF